MGFALKGSAIGGMARGGALIGGAALNGANVGASWTPFDDPAIDRYKNASVLESITPFDTPGKISAWADLKDPGPSDWVQATALDQPSSGLDLIGGKNAITFPGVSDFFDIPAADTGLRSFFMAIVGDTAKSRHCFLANFSGVFCVQTFTGQGGSSIAGVGSPTFKVNDADEAMATLGDAQTLLITDTLTTACFIGYLSDNIDEFGEFGTGADFQGLVAMTAERAGSFTDEQCTNLHNYALQEFGGA